jgi:hypothetical protein
MSSTVNEPGAVAEASLNGVGDSQPTEMFITYKEITTLMTICKMFKRKTSRRAGPKFIRRSQAVLEKFGVEQLNWIKLEDGSLKLDTRNTPKDVSANIIKLGRNVVDKLDEEIEKQLEADKARMVDLQHEDDSVGEATHPGQNRTHVIEGCKFQIFCLEGAIYQLSRYKEELA